MELFDGAFKWKNFKSLCFTYLWISNQISRIPTIPYGILQKFKHSLLNLNDVDGIPIQLTL